MEVRPLPRVRVPSKPEQSEKAREPRAVTESGMVRSPVRPSQPEKAECPISGRPGDRVREVKPVQS